jgi:hypothetical protein
VFDEQTHLIVKIVFMIIPNVSEDRELFAEERCIRNVHDLMTRIRTCADALKGLLTLFPDSAVPMFPIVLSISFFVGALPLPFLPLCRLYACVGPDCSILNMGFPEPAHVALAEEVNPELSRGRPWIDDVV